MLDASERRGACTASVTRDNDVSACALLTPLATTPTPTSLTSFTLMRALDWHSSGHESAEPNLRWSKYHGEAAD